MIIKAYREKLNCDPEEAQDYLNVINGIIWDCWNNDGFEPGWRNSIAVDLSVSCHMLGLDAIDVLDALIKAKIIDPVKDDEDTHKRVQTCFDYERRFSWDWMIDADIYKDMGEEHQLQWDLMGVNVRLY